MNIKFGVEQTTTQRFEWIYEVADGLSADEIQNEIENYIKKNRRMMDALDVPYVLIKLGRLKNIEVKQLDRLEDDSEPSEIEFDTFEITESNNFDEEYPDDCDDDDDYEEELFDNEDEEE